MAVLTIQPHFVLFPFMAQGHTIPMIDIARLLAQRGVKITILTTHLNATRFKTVVDRAIESGLKIQVIHLYFPSLESGLPEGCENFDMLPSMDLGLNFFDATKKLQPQVEDLLQELNPSPNCLISDMCFPWTTNVAQKFNIPRIVFHGMCCFSLLCLHNLSGWKELEKIESDKEYFQVPGLHDKIELNIVQLASIVRPRDSYWKELGDQIRKAEDEAYGIVVNSFEDLEQEYVMGLKKAKDKKIWTIGPVSLCNIEKQDKAERGNKASIEEHQCLKWLDSWEENSVLFVCLGSLSRLPTQQMIELGIGLESSRRPFIWVVRHMSHEFQKWLVEENFEERVKGQGLLIHGWAPQVLILSHASVGGFLTHCGWNSSLEGITAGMPMITWPMFAEQFCNERLIVNVLKTGVRAGIENPVMFGEEEKVGAQVSKDDIKKVIEEVFGEEEEAEMRRKRAKKLGEMAKRAVEEGGSSYFNLTQLIQDVTEQAKF
ncbi:UDP-glycosyltransferase 73C4-like [Nicotiana tabacum]|uniref:Glycosyltransferase n=2 Tax=Nicotiana TaxID=4085 RepID=A0A1S3WXX9_TOBAC|nr:PREDICTED: UDP-glycosyltransferase 73C3-like [Nicotiana sylvestris]XP_016432472.1 PREDICTED: UDP-glycosyltransferase 73C3-like [Nicotiana tabacum]WIW42899.1 UDP-glycosyltransferase [Nicotiana tabacum]